MASKTKIKEKKVYYDSFFIAGFSYYEGTLNFKKLEVGDKVDIVIDDENTYDKHALIIKYKDAKLGYIPKRKNKAISKIIRSGYNIFEAYIQQKDSNAHSEEQIKIIIYIKSKTGKEFNKKEEDITTVIAPVYKEPFEEYCNEDINDKGEKNE